MSHSTKWTSAIGSLVRTLPCALHLRFRATAERYPDNAQKYDGAPAALQIFGRRFDEEKLLSIAQLVVNALERNAKRLSRKDVREATKIATATL